MNSTNIKNIVTTLAVTLVMVSCGGGNGNKQTVDGKKETKSGLVTDGAFAIKYNSSETTIICTRSADGDKKRVDYIYSDGEHSISMEVYVKGSGYTGYQYENGQWEDDSYSARQRAANLFLEIRDLSAGYVNHGFTQQADQTICGKKCQVYAGTHPKDMKVAGYSDLNLIGSHEEIAVWNGITMQLKYNDKVVLEAKAITFDVPDKAFTKTTDVTWIN